MNRTIASVFRPAASLILAVCVVVAGASCGDDDPIPGSGFKSAIKLTEGVWKDGTLASSDGEQWFTFTATASAQYIHADFGSLTRMRAQVYDKSGSNVVESEFVLEGDGKRS